MRSSSLLASRASTLGGALIDAIGLPPRDYQEKNARAYMDLEAKFDQLAICEPHRRISAPEVQVAKLEEFEARLVGVESWFYLINELERRVAMIEHRQQLHHEELVGMRASMCSAGRLARIED